jgi:hypothetical protein
MESGGGITVAGICEIISGVWRRIKAAIRVLRGYEEPQAIFDDTTYKEQLLTAAAEYLRQLNQKQLYQDLTTPTTQTDPCETCLRWPECNGVDRDTCPLCGWEEKKIKKDKKAVPAYLDDRTESGLLEE